MSSSKKLSRSSDVPDRNEILTAVHEITNNDKIKSLIKTIDKGIEFEIRFGINDGSGRFISNLGYDVHRKIKKGLKSEGNWTTERSIVMTNTNSSSNYRHIKYFDDAWVPIRVEHNRKIAIDKYDNLEYGIRFSIAKDELLPDNYEPSVSDRTKNRFRYRYRKSILLDSNWRLDLSKTRSFESINTQDLIAWKDSLMEDENRPDEGIPGYQYEIELEYVGKVKNYDDIYNEMLVYIAKVYEHIYNSKQEIHKQIRLNIFMNIREKLSARHQSHFQSKPIDQISIKDIGNQVITMEMKHLSKIQTEEYSVTEKTDGERMLLYSVGGNVINFITGSNTLKTITPQKNTNLGTFLLDGEFVELDDVSIFYVFDVLISKNHDVTQMQFPKRQMMAEDIINNIVLPKNSKILITKKIFQEITQTTFFSKNKLVLEAKRDYDIDGLIYTPMKGNYFDPIYKWKMSHTVDFLVKKASGTKYNLYVKATKADLNANGWKFPKNYATFFPTIDQENAYHFPFPFITDNKNQDDEKWYTTEISDERVKALGIEDDIIVEFKWNASKEKWVAINTRPERTAIYKDPANKTFFGNSYMNAISIYRCIVNPLTEDMMTGKEPIPSAYWQTGNKELIRPMLKFHSYVKIRLYNDYCKNAESVLELGGGQSNDFKKWVNSGISHVTLIDPDPIAVEEGKDRTKDVSKPSITYIVADAAQGIKRLLEKNSTETSYDVIVANFSIHYFTITKEQIELLIKNVREVLLPGGFFVFTTFNGEKVFSDLEKSNPIILSNKNEKTLFSITKKYPESDKKLKHYGQMIDVFVESIGIPHEEGLMNLKYLIEKFCENDRFTLVENVSFADLMDNYQERDKLSVAEKRYSGYNNLVALRFNEENNTL
jgi:ubiquinone/menaquinone biosynthesis C-methylase UbiE